MDKIQTFYSREAAQDSDLILETQFWYFLHFVNS